MSEQSKNSNRLAPVKRETGANPVRTRHRDREQEPQNHWETGKMADAMILSRETCLNAVQKRKFQTTSKKVVRNADRWGCCRFCTIPDGYVFFVYKPFAC